MNILVDTCIWSLVLRRQSSAHTTEERGAIQAVRRLVIEQRIAMIGPIRQELLSGIRHDEQFDLLLERLRAFPDIPLDEQDYETAASFSNRCRRRGIQGSSIDMLICAVANRRGLAIYTSDQDFDHYGEVLTIERFAPH